MKGFVLLCVVIVGIILLARPHSPDGSPGIVDLRSAAPSAPDPAAEERGRRYSATHSIEIKNFSWSAEFSMMTVNLTFVNPSDYDVRDLEVRCTHSAPSGTTIDANNRTIYEVVPARGSKRIQKFNMGFIHSQAKQSGCYVVNAVAGDYRAPPPPPAPKPAPKPGAPLALTPK